MTHLGIDGGGSKTVFLVCDDQDREVLRIQTGPSNWLSVGKDAAAAAIRDGVSQVIHARPAAVCGGFAGAGRPEGLAFYRQVIEPLFPDIAVAIESDAYIAYAGAIGLRPGVLLIAGTGSIAIGRKADGAMIRTGGWGPHFGDEGGGFWIGREAIRAALRRIDSGREGAFNESLQQALGIGSVRDVVFAWSAQSIGVPEIAALAPTVFQFWPEEPAAGIIRLAADHLRGLIITAQERIGNAQAPVAMIGSVALHPLMQELIAVASTPALRSPEWGAIQIARSLPATN